MAINRYRKIFMVALLLDATVMVCSDREHAVESISEQVYVSNETSVDLCGSSAQSDSPGRLSDCSSPWSYCDEGVCKCANTTEILQCHLHGHSLVAYGYCVTFSENTSATKLGYCVYGIESVAKSLTDGILLPYVPLPNVSELNEFMCGPFNRAGTLCGRCREGFYPLAYSFDMKCVKCPNGRSNWWRFVLAAFLPLTLFYFIVLLFRINVTSSHLHGFIYCSQLMAIPACTCTQPCHVFSQKKSARNTCTEHR